MEQQDKYYKGLFFGAVLGAAVVVIVIVVVVLCPAMSTFL